MLRPPLVLLVFGLTLVPIDLNTRARSINSYQNGNRKAAIWSYKYWPQNDIFRARNKKDGGQILRMRKDDGAFKHEQHLVSSKPNLLQGNKSAAIPTNHSGSKSYQTRGVNNTAASLELSDPLKITIPLVLNVTSTKRKMLNRAQHLTDAQLGYNERLARGSFSASEYSTEYYYDDEAGKPGEQEENDAKAKDMVEDEYYGYDNERHSGEMMEHENDYDAEENESRR